MSYAYICVQLYYMNTSETKVASCTTELETEISDRSLERVHCIMNGSKMLPTSHFEQTHGDPYRLQLHSSATIFKLRSDTFPK